MPTGWTALDPPTFAASAGVLGEYRSWLGAELGGRGRSVLGGHSMGGALALLVASDQPDLVERLVLVNPAGLPLTKPIRKSVADFCRQVRRGIYPAEVAARGAAAVARAPRAALRLAQEVRSLDLTRECKRLRTAGVPTLVVGCTSDTLVACSGSRRLADALGADYVEHDSLGGHMWMLRERERFGEFLLA